jgi:putative ABC transport system permease protein
MAFQSLINRRLTTILTIFSVSLSITLLLGVERVRNGARDSFTNTISGTDLIVGSRGGTIQLLLYAVFRMGSATNNLSYESFQKISALPEVAWTIPYSLGDSHRGFRVVGTNSEFYKRYQYQRGKNIAFASGTEPSSLFEVVIGSAVAKKLKYKTGDRLTLAHGISEVSFQNHDDKPFTVTGVLAPTGTPIDRSLYISLEGIEALHVDWQDGAPPLKGEGVSAQELAEQQIQVRQITAFLLGAKSRIETLNLQRFINEYEDEALMAIIPGVALSELWDGISYAEDGLRVVSLFVVIVGLLGMLVSVYNSLNERRREMAILRSVGAGPKLIFGLLMLESTIITGAGIITGIVVMYLGLFISQPILAEQFGLYIPIALPGLFEWIYLGIIGIIGLLMGAVPAWRAYHNTLSDGLTIKI